MRRKVLVAVTAMLLATQLGLPLAAAEPSTEQLNAIATYLEANNVQGLRDYLEIYPELTEGNTTLAILLRRFMVESAAADYYDFKPNLSDALNEPGATIGATAPDEPAEQAY